MKNICDPMIPQVWHVVSMMKENSDTFTMVLKPDNGDKFAFESGQFTMLYAHGVGEMAISISGDASVNNSVTHTIRAVGAGTRALEKLEAGHSVGLRGPFGSSWPVDKIKDKDVIIVAGGIGLAPLRPVIYYLLAANNERVKNNLKTTIIYGSRSPDDQIFKDELTEWQKIQNWDFICTVDKPATDWKGNVGLVTKYFPASLPYPTNTIVLTCGPEIMMSASAEKLKELGLPGENIYLSMERNMNCGIGLCGHCQMGPHFICKDGPVFRYPDIKHLMGIKEI